ncbi:hypothetical protein HYH03_002081 [Edaphochlamys debaryana]|uniref:RNA helicase n=1 Tax=Edaphochlamys debaryana TaxID=47281 RepID=A0A835YDM9_9CHLO|nr:hypothetical protein HYH03_002081 [Edaphochlamys debaryana]|eukprot:KAG2499784.1 hypothetical protein HYH03_002081 [Edaphochlamys debaryana]
MTKTSKRQQKNKNVGSLRNKSGGEPASALDLLSDELRQQYEESGINPDDLIIASGAKKKGKKGGAAKDEEEEAPELSKSQLRKLKQVQLKKERRDNISQVLATLNAHAASDAALALMRPLHQRGQRETKKQRLRRELQMQRAGLAAPGSEGELLRRRKVPGADGGGSGSDADGSDGKGSGDEEDEESEEEHPAGPRAAAAAPAPAATAPSGADSEEEEEEGSDAEEAAAGAAAATGGKQGPQPAPAPPPLDPAAARRQALAAARGEAERIRAQELGGVLPAVQDDALGDAAEVAAARRQAAAAAAEAAHFPHRLVSVARPPAMAAARLELPISGLEADIMEAVAANDVIVLAGETGCGKTTQVPQFLLEAGFGCRDFPERAGAVGITQPRRVAAVATAQRVAAELGCQVGEAVGYQVRYDKAAGGRTSLKFMTDGILLRELQADFSLSAYSAIIVDEAHERALNTDLLLGMLSRIVPLRRRLWRERQEAAARGEAPPGPPVYPLKLIIMSATLRTADFTGNTRLFPSPPPVISVPARQYPVTVHFSRRTEMRDYVAAAFRKVVRIHSELPPGGVLVFLTGQREVEQLCRRLRSHFSARDRRAATAAAGGGRARDGPCQPDAADGADGGAEAGEAEPEEGAFEEFGGGGGGDRAEVAGDAAERRRGGRGEEEEQALDDYGELNGDDEEGDEDEEEVHVMGGDQFTPEEIAEAERRFEEAYGKQMGAAGAATAGAAGAGSKEGAGQGPIFVLPLYAMLPQAQQARVFQPPPPGHRLIVVATNVAETSLTIPGIRYVVDAGRSKQKLLEDASAPGGSGGTLARYEVRWVSKASAAQRAGRAGRTCPGHTYRLFSSAHFNDTFPDHSPPEILNTSLEGVVLVMKAMGVDRVHNFPFPTPPDAASLRSAHACLEALGALVPAGGAAAGRLTPIGRAMAAFPISPRHARMLFEVLKWSKGLQGAGDDDDDGGGPGGLSVSDAAVRRAGRALPYAVALAAAVSVESPFVHIDTVGSSGGQNDEAAEDKEGKDAADEGEEEEEEDEEEGKVGAGDDAEAEADARGGKRRKPPPKGKGARATKSQRRSGGDASDEDEGGGAGPGPGPGSAGTKAAAKAARAAARRRREAAVSMQARFRHSQSDSLSALAALVAFEASGESEEFASAHFLHGRNLREAADLHRQLLRVLAMQQAASTAAEADGDGGGGGALAAELAEAARALAEGMALPTEAAAAAAAAGGRRRKQPGGAAGPLTVATLLPEKVATVLRRALAAGWADQVARRVRSVAYLAQLGESRRKRHAVRYEAACLPPSAAEAAAGGGGGGGAGVGGGVFLHPRSSLHAAAPELLVYGSLLATDKRPYMVGVTAVEAEWLTESGTPLCILSSAILPDPPPAYRPPPADCVVAWREARYGPLAWPLPPVAAPHPDATERAAVLAAALLEGRVLPGMAELRSHLVSAPAMLLRPELRGVARVGELVGALVRARVDSRRSLAAAWARAPTTLQRELAAWLPKSQHSYLLRLWPRLQEQAASGAGASGVQGAGKAGGAGAGAGAGPVEEATKRGAKAGRAQAAEARAGGNAKATQDKGGKASARAQAAAVLAKGSGGGAGRGAGKKQRL